MVKNLINKFSIKRTIYFEHYVRQIRQVRQINIISPRRIFSNVRKGERYMVKILKDIFSIKKKTIYFEHYIKCNSKTDVYYNYRLREDKIRTV